MTLAEDVDLEEYIMSKVWLTTENQFYDKSMSVIQLQDDLSGADIKAICTEAGLLALRERRMKVRNKILF